VIMKKLKFKVGDKVKIVGCYRYPTNVGKVGIVTEILSETENYREPYMVRAVREQFACQQDKSKHTELVFTESHLKLVPKSKPKK